MVVWIGVGIAILLWVGYFIWFKQTSKQVDQDLKQKQKVDPQLTFRDLLLNVSWSDIMDELKRIDQEQRDLLKIQNAYHELLQLQPYQRTDNLIIYLNVNENSNFFDIYAQEQGDPYIEYMIDYDDWRQILQYLIDQESLKKYGKLTLVAAVLYSITSGGYSLKEVMEKKKALH